MNYLIRRSGGLLVPVIAFHSNAHVSNCEEVNLKKLVGYQSVDRYIKSNMKVGLGTGSTAFYAVERIGQKLKSGELKNIVCVPTSEKTRQHAS